MEIFESAFSDGAAFIPYLAAGDPGPGATIEDPAEAMTLTEKYVMALLDGGADVIELGLPFSEPIADGPTIQEAAVRALEAGMTPRRFLDLVANLPDETPIVAMTYFNLIYQYGQEPGVDAFVEAAAKAGVDGLIVPDLPVEESSRLQDACADAGIALIFIVAPTTRADRLERVLAAGSGYLYVQSRLGTTGAKGDLSDQTRTSLERIAAFEREAETDPLPKAVGFGVSTPEQARDIVAAGADGVIVGSALVDQLDGTDRETTVTTLRSMTQDLKRGAVEGRERRTTGPERQ